MTDDEQIDALATAATKLGSEIIGTYADQQQLRPEVVGLGAMHAAVFALVRAGWSPERIAGLASDHAEHVVSGLLRHCNDRALTRH